MIKHFDINEIGRDFVVGDIHGCFKMLDAELSLIDFDPDIDRLFSVGDLVDRGDQSEDCLIWLEQPWFHGVRGNHEQMAIDYLAGSNPANLYILNGGAWFLGMTYEEQCECVNVFESLPIAIEVDTKHGLIGIVHADCPVDDWNELAPGFAGDRSALHVEACLWSRYRSDFNVTDEIENITRVFVGHTPARVVKHLGNVVYIDTGAVFGNLLTVMQIN